MTDKRTRTETGRVISYYREKINSSRILSELDLESNQYFLVSAHREENIDSDLNFGNLVDTLNSIGEIYVLPIIVSTHPRTQKRIDAFSSSFNHNIRFLKPIFIFYGMLICVSYNVFSRKSTYQQK